MPTSPSYAIRRAISTALGVSLVAAPAWAQAPVMSLSDLVNQSSDYSQRELPRRGYVFIHADPRGSKTWEYGWKPGENVGERGLALVGGLLQRGFVSKGGYQNTNQAVSMW